jgi:hypothetical protein
MRSRSMSFLQRISPLVFGLLAAGCSREPAPAAAPSATSPAAAPAAEGEVLAWRVIGTWSGRGNAQLETFPIERQTWRVRWETKNESPAGTGTFYLTANSGDSGRIMAEVVDATGNDHDVAYVSDVPHRYYLVVTSSNVDWTVSAEEPAVQ